MTLKSGNKKVMKKPMMYWSLIYTEKVLKVEGRFGWVLNLKSLVYKGSSSTRPTILRSEKGRVKNGVKIGA